MSKPRILLLTQRSKAAGILVLELSRSFEVRLTEAALFEPSQFLSSEKWKPQALMIDSTFSSSEVLEILEQMKVDPLTRSFPVILVGRNASPSFLNTAAALDLSHYIAIPYEPKILIEKTKAAINPWRGVSNSAYFRLKQERDLKLVSFAQCLSINPKEIYFCSHLKLEPNSKLRFSSFLTKDLNLAEMEVVVKSRIMNSGSAHPYLIKAEWQKKEVSNRLSNWIAKNQKLTFPPRSRILIVSASPTRRQEFSEVISLTNYSPYFIESLNKAFAHLRVLQPEAILLYESEWEKIGPPVKARFFKEISRLGIPWILAVDKLGIQSNYELKPFLAPKEPEGLALAISKIAPLPVASEERFHFSERWQHSWMKLHLVGASLQIGELGMELATENSFVAPCNLQAEFSLEEKKPPFRCHLRIWPPMKRPTFKTKAYQRFKTSFISHYLGINDQDGQRIRTWLIEEQLKEKRKKLAPKPPK